MSPWALVEVLRSIWTDLPPLLGERWESVKRQIWTALDRMHDDPKGARDAILEALTTNGGRALALVEQEAARIAETLMKSGNKEPAGTIEVARHVEVPVHFGTDRKPTQDGFGAETNPDGLSLGVAWVSVPEDHIHKRGRMERPPWWWFGWGWNPDKHVMRLGMTVQSEEEFVAEARKRLESATRREALIFIHGYNVDFDDAVRAAAQLAYDVQFPGLSMLYSWPSKGGRLAYVGDGDRITASHTPFEDFLQLAMTKLGLTRVHVLAHSMGNRLLTDVLQTFDASTLPEGAGALEEVIFAAPDVSQTAFTQRERKFRGKAGRYTLYASSKDRALKLSEAFHDSLRAGDSGGFRLVLPGIDTIDATEADMTFMGHSAFARANPVVTDIQLAIRNRMPAKERPQLKEEAAANPPFYYFVPAVS